MTNREITNLLTKYKSQYYKKYWNAGISDSQLSADNWGVTSSKDGPGNSFGKAIQCYGFSLFLAYVLFGDKINSTEVDNEPNGTVITGESGNWVLYKNNYSGIDLEPGDIVRGDNNSHSAVVWKIENGYVKFAESWGGTDNYLNWGDWQRTDGRDQKTVAQVKALATYILKAPKTQYCGLDHTYGSDYSSDTAQHWKTCIYCSYKNKASHTVSPAYTSNAFAHWKPCRICGYETNKGPHSFTQVGSQYKCSVCGYISTNSPSSAADPIETDNQDISEK